MPRELPNHKIPIDAEYSKHLYQRLLKRLETATYREVLEMPYIVREIFEETYPERCPKKKEIVEEPFQTKLEEVKCKKSQKNDNQPSLF